MKYVLILLLHMNWGASATSAVFDDKDACLAASKQVEAVWSGVEKRAFCLSQSSKETAHDLR